MKKIAMIGLLVSMAGSVYAAESSEECAPTGTEQVASSQSTESKPAEKPAGENQDFIKEKK